MEDDIGKLIDELLTHELRPNTREDLATWRGELAAGALSKDDARYIRALHARVVLGGVAKAEDVEDEPEDEVTPSEVARLREELAASRQREQALAGERDRMEREIAALRSEIDALKAGKG